MRAAFLFLVTLGFLSHGVAGAPGDHGVGGGRPKELLSKKAEFTVRQLKEYLRDENFAVDGHGKLFRPGKPVKNIPPMDPKEVRFCFETPEMARLKELGYVIDGTGRVFEKGLPIGPKDVYGAVGEKYDVHDLAARLSDPYGGRVGDQYGGKFVPPAQPYGGRPRDAYGRPLRDPYGKPVRDGYGQ